MVISRGQASWTGTWLATSAKVAIVLPQTRDGGKNVRVVLKILSQGATFVKVANS
jgi:hypothetical protein